MRFFQDLWDFLRFMLFFLYLLDCLEIYEIHVFMRLMGFTNLQVISATNLLVERSIQEQIARGFPNCIPTQGRSIQINRGRFF